jgi:hypothetical protein
MRNQIKHSMKATKVEIIIMKAVIKTIIKRQIDWLFNRTVERLCMECGNLYKTKAREDLGFCSGKCHGDYEFAKVIDNIEQL